MTNLHRILHRRPAALALFFAVVLPLALSAQQGDGTPEPHAVEVDVPLLVAELPVDVEIRVVDESRTVLEAYTGAVTLTGFEATDGVLPTSVQGGRLLLEDVLVPTGEYSVSLPATNLSASGSRDVLPGFVTLLPPIIAIALALLTRQVLISLFCGVWVGALLVYGANPLSSLLRTLDTYVIGAFADADHAHVIIFSLSLAGMVGIITATGGVKGIVEAIARRARSPRAGQVATAAMGSAIFFDDYANSLVVGNTMRPLTDRLRISREKLAFLVDATAAPIATVGVISTWTAYQVGLIRDELPGAGIGEHEPYLFFLGSIPMAFYSWLMLLLVFASAWSLRDYGPMRKAEVRARTTGAVLAEGAQPLAADDIGAQTAATPVGHWSLAAVPVLAVIVFTALGLYVTGLQSAEPGSEPTLREIISGADSFRALLWAGCGASIVAAILARLRGWKLDKIIDAWVGGVRSLTLAAIILLLAWSISAACKDLRTGEYVLELTRGFLSAEFVPLIAFVTAALIALSTGTSYGTMGILIPVLLPLAGQLALADGAEAAAASSIAQATIAAILGGAVFGDHCSPISDTTVLSSMATGSDHIDHVRTQFPYALLVGLVCVPCYVLVGFGWSAAVVMPLGIVAVMVAFFCLGRRVE